MGNTVEQRNRPPSYACICVYFSVFLSHFLYLFRCHCLFLPSLSQSCSLFICLCLFLSVCVWFFVISFNEFLVTLVGEICTAFADWCPILYMCVSENDLEIRICKAMLHTSTGRASTRHTTQRKGEGEGEKEKHR